eukprot:CAMPEP_0182546364 /NCGR_PEP_ID=MMETSP1323-20130603/35942_1 /TAXON_ID=236787 /ORGANISM="Florenciella parvula, Strain RCC1693" /LENGTH=135 /DNA_ID=CAMNT_0024757583 /DNA_START=144 /DNA_END=551 /DNA_ORIENTATION=+
MSCVGWKALRDWTELRYSPPKHMTRVGLAPPPPPPPAPFAPRSAGLVKTSTMRGCFIEPTTKASEPPTHLGSQAAWKTGRYRPVWLSWEILCTPALVPPSPATGMALPDCSYGLLKSRRKLDCVTDSSWLPDGLQ